MNVLKSLVSAFLMYSKIPMPYIEWKEENKRYALCFFPMIGMVIGFVFLVWNLLCSKFNVGIILKSVGSVLIPIIITGGIHLDGFCDVTDAVSSYATKEKKLNIMKDPHIGSFALIKLCCYLIFQSALFSEVKFFTATIVIAFGYILSRSLSGIAAVSFKCAKNTGTLQSFVKPAHKNITIAVLSAVIVITSGLMIFFSPMIGCFVLFGAIVSFIFYRFFSYKAFGGITGDTAGWFLQICEMSVLVFAVIGEKILEVSAK